MFPLRLPPPPRDDVFLRNWIIVAFKIFLFKRVNLYLRNPAPTKSPPPRLSLFGKTHKRPPRRNLIAELLNIIICIIYAYYNKRTRAPYRFAPYVQRGRVNMIFCCCFLFLPPSPRLQSSHAPVVPTQSDYLITTRLPFLHCRFTTNRCFIIYFLRNVSF